jgi:hypothetical protein
VSYSGVSGGESERQKPPGRSTFDVDVGKTWFIAAGVAAMEHVFGCHLLLH